MRIYGPKNSYERNEGYTVVRSAPPSFNLNFKTVMVLVFIILISNLLTVVTFRSWGGGEAIAAESIAEEAEIEESNLYLMDKARTYVDDEFEFEVKVREVCLELNIPPEWLMAVMYSESKFNASVANHRGSGAVGLIQWMPITAKEMDVTTAELKKMDHLEQLDYVEEYLENVKERYGDFKSLTELYLGILYPKALDQDYCYTLYAKPSKMYKQNVGLDENKDGRVTVSDIDKRMQRVFPTAYLAML